MITMIYIRTKPSTKVRSMHATQASVLASVRDSLDAYVREVGSLSVRDSVADAARAAIPSPEAPTRRLSLEEIRVLLERERSARAGDE